MTTTLETKRCLLRPPCIEDREVIWSLYCNPEVRRFLGGAVARPDFDSRFDKAILGASNTWVIQTKAEQIFCGIISLALHHDGGGQEVSFQLSPETQGQGIASEALEAIKAYAKDTMGLAMILAETQEKNLASRRLLERKGFSLTRTLERFGEDQYLYRCDL